MGDIVTVEMGSWRDSGREAKFWIFNVTTAFPVLFFMVNISWLTFGLVVSTVIVFSVLEYYGFKPKVFFRFLRSFLAGSRKPAKPWWIR